MRILTRYLLRAHIGPFLFALVALTGILFVNAVARRFQDLAGKGLPLRVILEVFLYSMPHILALTLPMAVLVSVLYAFAQLAADNEITALKASGTNLIRLIMPLVAVAFLFTLFMVWFNDRVLPNSNHELKTLMMNVSAKTPTLSLREQVINPIGTQDFQTRYWLKAKRIDPSQKMYDVVIYDMSSAGARKSRTVYADSGFMVLNGEQTDMLLTLYDGEIHETSDETPNDLQRVSFNEQKVELKGIGTQLQRTADDYRSDRELSIADMRARVDTTRAELEVLMAHAAEVNNANFDRVLAGPDGSAGGTDKPGSLGEPMTMYNEGYERDAIVQGADDVAYRAALDAQRVANQAQTLQDRINQYEVEIHKKFAIPVACIIFVLIGAPLAVRFPRGGVGMVIASSLTIFAVYYMSLIGGESLGDRGMIRPFVGPWAPNLVFGLIALWGLSRIGRETATSRGGGWDDLWMTVRGIFRLRRGRS